MTDKILNSKIYKHHLQLNTKKQTTPSKQGQKISTDNSPKKRHTYGQKTHEKMFNIIRETEIKTTLRYHLTPARRAIIQKSTNNKCWRGYGGKGTLVHCWWDCKLVQPLWKAVWRFLRKLNIELPFDPAIPLLGICPEKTMT